MNESKRGLMRNFFPATALGITKVGILLFHGEHGIGIPEYAPLIEISIPGRPIAFFMHVWKNSME